MNLVSWSARNQADGSDTQQDSSFLTKFKISCQNYVYPNRWHASMVWNFKKRSFDDIPQLKDLIQIKTGHFDLLKRIYMILFSWCLKISGMTNILESFISELFNYRDSRVLAWPQPSGYWQNPAKVKFSDKSFPDLENENENIIGLYYNLGK